MAWIPGRVIRAFSDGVFFFHMWFLHVVSVSPITRPGTISDDLRPMSVACSSTQTVQIDLSIDLKNRLLCFCVTGSIKDPTVDSNGYNWVVQLQSTRSCFMI